MDKTGNVQKKSVNIICLYWVGDFRGRDFTEDDVIRLYRTVERHIDRPFHFYCLTNKMDANVPGEKIQLKNNWPGWWSKMELHRPDLPKGRTLYLDLDSKVISSLQPILDFEGNLVMFPNRMATSRPGVINKYQAATMLFDSGCMNMLYRLFCSDPDVYMRLFRADQDFMGKYAPDQPTFPSKWMRKLRECLMDRNNIPKDAIIITGQPKDNWFRRYQSELPWLDPIAYGDNYV